MPRTHVSDDCNEAWAAAGEEGWPVVAGGQDPPHFSPFSRDTGDAREATAHPRGRGKPADYEWHRPILQYRRESKLSQVHPIGPLTAFKICIILKDPMHLRELLIILKSDIDHVSQ